VQNPRLGSGLGQGAYASPIDYYYFTAARNDEIGNPDLKPEKTVDYEVGFTQQLNKNSALTINGYYKERRDQIQVRTYVNAYPQTYTTYGNRDFSSTKGMSLRYDMRRINHVQLSLSYTLQFAEGTGSSSTSSRGSQGLLQSLVSAALPNLRFITPLDYDSRHNISAIFDYRFDKGKGPEIGGKKALQNAGINLLFTAHSGSPYTRYQEPDPANSMQGMHGTNTISGGINGSRLPWFYMLDLKIDKTFELTSLAGKQGEGRAKARPLSLNAYCYMQNVLNLKMIQAVYGYTGSPTDDGYLTSPQGEQTINNQYNQAAFAQLYNIKAADPTFYYSPRRIFIGLQLNF
jgi:hypothetical protein